VNDEQRDDQRELTVLLADDHAATRVGIRRAIESHDLRVVAEASTAAEALRAAREQRPDVCMLATRLPGNGIEATRQIKQSLPDTKIVLLTAVGRSEELFEALRAGADGYLLMTSSPARLPHVIRGVANGETAIPREMTTELIKGFRERGNRRHLSIATVDGGVELTAREFDVLERLRKGERTAEVAAQLGISEITVRRHVSSIVHKLGAPNRSSAMEMLDREDRGD
jgi:two-component system, NarL family, nitrate/nitrite response regulator NarL